MRLHLILRKTDKHTTTTASAGGRFGGWTLLTLALLATSGVVSGDDPLEDAIVDADVVGALIAAIADAHRHHQANGGGGDVVDLTPKFHAKFNETSKTPMSTFVRTRLDALLGELKISLRLAGLELNASKFDAPNGLKTRLIAAAGLRLMALGEELRKGAHNDKTELLTEARAALGRIQTAIERLTVKLLFLIEGRGSPYTHMACGLCVYRCYTARKKRYYAPGRGASSFNEEEDGK